MAQKEQHQEETVYNPDGSKTVVFANDPQRTAVEYTTTVQYLDQDGTAVRPEQTYQTRVGHWLNLQAPAVAGYVIESGRMRRLQVRHDQTITFRYQQLHPTVEVRFEFLNEKGEPIHKAVVREEPLDSTLHITAPAIVDYDLTDETQRTVTVTAKMSPEVFHYHRHIIPLELNMSLVSSQMIEAINQFRAEKQLSQLTINMHLQTLSYVRADTQRKNHVLDDHEGLRPSLQVAGYKGQVAEGIDRSWLGTSEIQTAQQLLDRWRKDPTKYAQLIQPDYDEIGLTILADSDGRREWVAVEYGTKTK
ncbi:hypothetical protein IV38_GL000460 [Lactobacillus selangorensis]|uniref:SCP domain-containing protein n=1 Tax=Lactobacillus selangorensis TaxID=81857 RepID=A0A0R2FPJ2_9LACO|nr:CAP domain-containing protein [Lactobacillus selangorensis]KRN29574.1 hypothetical protein IV38_GL000460 [Lactobacillus selangorensis]KRN33896.1 hypothetical protein IV40_GL000208 [Lactobacillus selangorensis]